MNKYGKQLEDLLKGFIKSSGHYGTGKLYKSVKVTISYSDDDVPVPKISANDYIIHLDDGKFIDKFMKLKEVKSVITKMYSEHILSGLNG